MTDWLADPGSWFAGTWQAAGESFEIAVGLLGATLEALLVAALLSLIAPAAIIWLCGAPAWFVVAVLLGV